MPERRRTMIVTGASSGIGRALALLAAREGFGVVAVARRTERLEELATAIRGAGGVCVLLTGDVTAPEMPARIAGAAVRTFGGIDVLVNNAGGGTYGPLLGETDAQIDAQWQLNVAAPLRIARAALPQLETARGQLVFVGSGSGRIPLPNFGAYAPAKAAIRAAAIQLRRELRSKGIAVTYVDPGLVATEFHSSIGIERATQVPVASAQRVAGAILRGIHRRAAVVHGVPWQSVGTVLGEWAGTLADPLIVGRFTPQRLRQRDDEEPAHREDHSGEAAEPKDSAGATFEAALAPVARRMERVKLAPSFLRDALAPGATLELNALAMRWAGMPNKNERAALREALDTLAASGYIEPAGEETWKVLRAAD